MAITANITTRDSAVYTITIHFSLFYEEWKAFIWLYIDLVENFRGGIVDKIRKVTT